MFRKLSIVFLTLQATLAGAQVPDTDLWLFRLKHDKQGKLVADKGTNITLRKGYDNQPAFDAAAKIIYYSSIREDGQADIYAYHIKKKKPVRLSFTTESEYSPVPLKHQPLLGSVVVEKDSAQRIHFIDPESGLSKGRLDVDSVGYYTFLNADTVIYYKLTEPHSLRYFVRSSGEDKWLCDAPARTFCALNRHTLLFGIRDSASLTFFRYDFLLGKAIRHTSYPSLSEDIFFHASLGLLKSEGAQLLRYDEAGGKWTPLFDLGSGGIRKITRFAIDPKTKYLVVADNPQP